MSAVTVIGLRLNARNFIHRNPEIVSRAALETQGIDIVDIDDAGRTAFKEAVRVVIEQGYADLPEAVLRAARSSPA